MDLFSQIPVNQPLAERMRPRDLNEVVGQDHLLGPDGPLTQLRDSLPSIIFWGPPGSGKTTIAKLLAADKPFEQISAVLSGVNELRNILQRRAGRGKQTVLFIDEIHRWNKAQQDALLPHVEAGSIILIGATTENPSFSIISPLLSRCRVFTLKSVSNEAIEFILRKAHSDVEHGIGAKQARMDDDALKLIVQLAQGDARFALNLLETTAKFSQTITEETVRKAIDRKVLSYDKHGENHYDVVSAFIKSMRGSDADATVYYLARMYESGEDPRYITRRMIIFAAEDIGNADPRALTIALSAAEAYDRVGSAEGWIVLSQAACYLAAAPKSNATYQAYKNAKIEIMESGSLPVPNHLRNAPTELMKSLNYGKGYQYAHDQNDNRVSHFHLPEEIRQKQFYFPSETGFEKKVKEYLAFHRSSKSKKSKDTSSSS